MKKLTKKQITERDEMQAHFDDRSERWQESEAGEKYQSWIEQYDAEFDEIDQSTYNDAANEMAVSVDDV